MMMEFVHAGAFYYSHCDPQHGGSASLLWGRYLTAEAVLILGA